ncbi:MAG: hypothetical protein J4F34_02075 [Gemmatimonadetes bacterium]|nr:hypothetical protein [Gemmatimonadota bacterium]
MLTPQGSPPGRWWLRVLASVWIAAATGAWAAVAAEQQRYDSAGVNVVVSDLPGSTLVLSLRPRVRIGAATGEDMYLLHSVGQARVLAGGRIVVANCLPPILRWYDSTGVYITGTGREGEGPEEFVEGGCANGMFVLDDGRVETWEHSVKRLKVFDPSGVQVSSLTANTRELGPGTSALGRFAGGYLMGEHRALGSQEVIDERRARPVRRSSWRDTLVFHRFGADGSRERAIGRVAWIEWAETVLPTEIGPFPTDIVVPFAPMGMAVPWGKVVAVGEGSRAEIELIDSDGRLTTIVRWKVERVPVTDEMIRTWIEGRLASDPNRDGRYLRDARRALEAYPYPDSAHLYSRFLVGTDRRLWVRNFRPLGVRTNTWFGFDSSGALACALAVPPGAWVLDIGDDYVLLVERDELDVESVAYYDMVDPGMRQAPDLGEGRASCSAGDRRGGAR